MNRRRREQILAYIGLLLCLAQVAVMIVAWIVNATGVSPSTRSLLGPEGIRWFFGHFVDNMQTPLLVWILLISISFGSVIYSGFAYAVNRVSRGMRLSYRERYALRLVVLELLTFISFMLMLTVIPHAILLSATGDLFPSSFSASLIPVIAFVLCFISVSYGAVSGKIRSMSEVFRALTIGIVGALPIFLYYILLVQLYSSVKFSFFTT